ncbi:Protein of unknown function [Cotesia congregata]|uniref:Uncharacterized protein n=1 Tax=Cotesia congregata TaxID=51543 RepID=A0A8J2H8S8_COTCN|nr:Protein of unknown function [Cotesia congregata]
MSVRRITRSSKQRSIMSSLVIPEPMKVIRHQINKVQKLHKVLNILGFTSALVRVLPVQVEPIKAPLFDKRDCVISEALSGFRIARHY